MKTPVVPLEDLPYTLSMVATISSQHGIQNIQCNCPLSLTEYLGDNKTSAQVISKTTLLLPAPLFLGPDLVPYPVFPKHVLLFPVNPEGITQCPSLSPFNLQSLVSILTPAPACSLMEEACGPQLWPQPQAAHSDSANIASLPVPTQITLADGHKFDRDVELLIYYSEVHTPSVAVEMGKPTTKPGIFSLPLWLPIKGSLLSWNYPQIMFTFFPSIQ